MFWCYIMIFVSLFSCHYTGYLCVSCGHTCLCTWTFVSVFVFHECLHATCFVCPSVCVCIVCNCIVAPPSYAYPPSESQEVSVDSEAALGGTGIPEISVTGVSGERMPNGDSIRSRPDGRIQPDCDTLGGASEVSLDPRYHDSSTRGQEVRRQKSVRRMVENEGSGSASTGRSQY